MHWWSWLLWLVLAVADGSTQAHATSGTAACPTADSPLGSERTPVLTTTCPSACSSQDMCLYFPKAHANECVSATHRECVHGDACAFQCLQRNVGSTNWLLTVYTDDAVADAVDELNTNKLVLDNPFLESFAINASQVRQWRGNLDFPYRTSLLFISGNDAANNVGTAAVDLVLGSPALPRGTFVPFELPPSFFQIVQRFVFLRVENLRLPDTASGGSSLSFPLLQELYLRNTVLTVFPLVNASFATLKRLDLSVNSISSLHPKTLPSSITDLNVSFNLLTSVQPDSLPSSLTSLDVSGNAIKAISTGILPSGLQKLFLAKNLLTTIPVDVAKLQELTTLSLDDNNLREIPQAAFPTGGIQILSVENCSLSSIPDVFKTMTEITELSLAHNTFSQNPDFSRLPKTLKKLNLENCQLNNLSIGLQHLSSLATLSLGKNPRAVENLSSLPTSLRTLLLNDNALDEVPMGVETLRVDTIILDLNPLGRLAPGSLPPTIQVMSMSNTTFAEIKPETLPVTVKELRVSDSRLTTTPQDIRAMRNLSRLVIVNSQLETFDAVDAVQNLQYLDLSKNRLSSFGGRFPSLLNLDLRQNTIQNFRVSDAFLLLTLHLGDNNLTAIPESVFQMTRLQLLNLTRNPIREFAPTAEQLASLSRIPIVIMNQDMFSSKCGSAERVMLHQYSVCAPLVKPSKRWVWLVPVNVSVASILALFVGLFWRHRKLQKKRLGELVIEHASLEKQQRHQAATAVWTDTVLLQNRLDDDLIERNRLLGSGGFTEVWLVTYKNEHYALKQVQQDASTIADRDRINAFVEEIKLLSSLSHVGILSVVGVVWTKESDIAMVTEYMAEGDLRAYLDRTPTIEGGGWTRPMVQVALQITETIVYLHSLEPAVIHRDLTCRTVLLDSTMRVKLSDVGVARRKLDGKSMAHGVGKERWVAPEVLAGEEAGESGDIFSLGVILSEIDTRKQPFEAAMTAKGLQLADAALASLLMSGSLHLHLSDACPAEIRSLVERCTAFDPSERPNGLQVAYELRQMLKSSQSWVKQCGVYRSTLQEEERTARDTTRLTSTSSAMDRD